jgi:hypothetical protein
MHPEVASAMARARQQDLARSAGRHDPSGLGVHSSGALLRRLRGRPHLPLVGFRRRLSH